MSVERRLRRSGLWPVPWLAVPFVVVAGLPVLLSWDEWAIGFLSNPVDWFLGWFIGVLPSLAIPLIGAAIVIRHRRAHRTVPLLLFGAMLIAVQVGAVRLIEPISRLVRDGPVTDSLFDVWNVIANVLTVVGAFGWTYLGRGLDRARRYEDVGPTALVVLVAVAIAVVTTAVQAGATEIYFGGSEGGLASTVVVTALVAGFLEKLAIGYVAATATRGWLAGEAPRRGWALAAVGGWALLAAFTMIVALPLLDPQWFVSGAAMWLFRAVSIVFSAGSVALVAAFALGLPDTDDITWYDLAELDGGPDGDAAADPFADEPEDDALDDGPALVEVSNRRLDR